MGENETFPAVADVLAIGCLLAIFAARLPRIKTAMGFSDGRSRRSGSGLGGRGALSHNSDLSAGALAIAAFLRCRTAPARGADPLLDT